MLSYREDIINFSSIVTMKGLPLDLFSYLLEFCDDDNTLRSLQLACKSFDDVILPVLWRTVSIDHDDLVEPYERICSRVLTPHFPVLGLLSSMDNRCAQYVKHLTVLCSPKYRDDDFYETENIKKFNEHLAGTLKRCARLESFRFRCAYHVTFPSSFAALGELRELRSLSVQFFTWLVGCKFKSSKWVSLGLKPEMITIPRLGTNLVRLSLDIPPIPFGDIRKTVDSISYTLAHSKRLRILELKLPPGSIQQVERPSEGPVTWREMKCETLWKDICLSYASHTEKLARGCKMLNPQTRLELRSLRLQGGAYLMQDEEHPSYLSDMVEMSSLEEVRYWNEREGDVTRSQELPQYLENWGLMLPASNLTQIKITYISSSFFKFVVMSNIFQRLRTLCIFGGQDRQFLDMLMVVKVQPAAPLRQLLYCSIGNEPSQEVAETIRRKLPNLTEIGYDARISENFDEAVNTVLKVARAFGHLQHLEKLYLTGLRPRIIVPCEKAISKLREEEMFLFPALRILLVGSSRKWVLPNPDIDASPLPNPRRLQFLEERGTEG